MIANESILQRRLSLSEMLDLPTFAEVVRGFCDLYKVGIKVFDEKGARLADVKVGNGDFCGYVFSFADGRGRCTTTVARVKEGPVAPVMGARAPDGVGPAGLIALPCFTGLRYLVMPIQWEGDVLGRVVFGPFVPDDLREFPQSLREISAELDPATLATHLAKVRRASESTIAKVMLQFTQILETLIAAGQKAYLTSMVHIETMLEVNRELEGNNARLEEVNARLKEVDRLKSTFLATVSHELRTPLTSIIGYSEMLAEGLAGALNEEQADYVRTIQDKGETLLRLISSILDISQIEAGKVRLSFESVDLGELVSGALSALRSLAGKKGVTLEVKVAEPAAHAQGDREKLRQVVINLVSNAVKFTPRGGKVTLAISAAVPQPELKGAEGYQLSVEDSGIGIPTDHLEKIFQSFYQVDTSSTREFGGAGLGLAIVKSYVEGHGGVVRVNSEVGQGARFTAVLPVVPPAPRALLATAVEVGRF